MAMLRFPLGQKVGDRLYRRLDGTLSYFFSKDALAQLATQAGFSVVRPSLLWLLRPSLAQEAHVMDFVSGVQIMTI